MSFFVDAAHFVMQPFLGFLWCFVRQFIQAPSGRKRFNVLGALHATSLQLVTVTNATYINAYSVAKLLCKLAVDFKDLPITLVMDNARYQRCYFIMDLATALGIELLFLPPYSPNLNLIERFWKYVKRLVSIPSITKPFLISSRPFPIRFLILVSKLYQVF